MTTDTKPKTTIRIPPPLTWIISFDHTGVRYSPTYGVTVCKAENWDFSVEEVTARKWERRLVPFDSAIRISLNYPAGCGREQRICDTGWGAPIIEVSRWSVVSMKDAEWFEKIAVDYLTHGRRNVDLYIPKGLYKRHKEIFHGTHYYDYI